MCVTVRGGCGYVGILHTRTHTRARTHLLCLFEPEEEDAAGCVRIDEEGRLCLFKKIVGRRWCFDQARVFMDVRSAYVCTKGAGERRDSQNQQDRKQNTTQKHKKGKRAS